MPPGAAWIQWRSSACGMCVRWAAAGALGGGAWQRERRRAFQRAVVQERKEKCPEDVSAMVRIPRLAAMKHPPDRARLRLGIEQTSAFMLALERGFVQLRAFSARLGRRSERPPSSRGGGGAAPWPTFCRQTPQTYPSRRVGTVPTSKLLWTHAHDVDRAVYFADPLLTVLHPNLPSRPQVWKSRPLPEHALIFLAPPLTFDRRSKDPRGNRLGSLF